MGSAALSLAYFITGADSMLNQTFHLTSGMGILKGDYTLRKGAPAPFVDEECGHSHFIKNNGTVVIYFLKFSKRWYIKFSGYEKFLFWSGTKSRPAKRTHYDVLKNYAALIPLMNEGGFFEPFRHSKEWLKQQQPKGWDDPIMFESPTPLRKPSDTDGGGDETT